MLVRIAVCKCLDVVEIRTKDGTLRTWHPITGPLTGRLQGRPWAYFSAEWIWGCLELGDEQEASW
jgi:hypothetical protein